MRKMMILSFCLFSVNAFANQTNFNYDFPGCEGGGGSWPASKMSLPHALCSLDDSAIEVTFRGRCNGWLTLGVSCQDSAIRSIEINDCFCD